VLRAAAMGAMGAVTLIADVKGVAASADYALERAVRRIIEIRAATGRGRAGGRR